MNSKDAGILTAYVAHVLHILAQAYLGLFLVLLISPIFLFTKQFLHGLTNDAPLSFEILFELFGYWWTNLFLLSFGQIVLLLIVMYMVGFVASECAYRLGILFGYHDVFSTERKHEKQIAEKDNNPYLFRSRLLDRPHLQKLWDWEQLQFHLCYYTEVGLALLSFGLGFMLVAYSVALALSDVARLDIWFWLTWILLTTSIFLWFLSRIGRKDKLENFRQAQEAISEVLKKLEQAR